MKWTLAAPVFACLASACTTAAPAPEPAGTPTSIRFETGVCFGTCPAFNAQVSSDGTGTYEGSNFVAVEGAASFAVSPSEFIAFERRLAPYRPAESVQYGYDNCDGPLATDNPSVMVTWLGEDGNSVTLDWYMGCRQPGLSENSNAIYQAWQELSGLAELVGSENLPRTSKGN